MSEPSHDAAASGAGPEAEPSAPSAADEAAPESTPVPAPEGEAGTATEPPTDAAPELPSVPDEVASQEPAAADEQPPAPVAPPAATVRPRPGPPPSVPGRPAPTPAPGPPAGTRTPASPGSSAAAKFGRVAEDGTVYVRLADGGERSVGQWAAGEPAEGLAYFARRYDDLSVEVDLATRRLRDRKAAVDQTAAVVRRAREALQEPAMVGDLAALEGQVAALEAMVAERQQALAAEKAEAHARILAAHEAIATEAESLAESTQWKATGERFKALLDAWKSTPRVDRAAEQEQWRRFSHARSVFDKRRRQHFAKLDTERGEIRQVKEAIVAEAEALSSSTDWGATAGAYRELMSRWKAAGRAGRTDEEQLWGRFRTAQDAFFSARNAALHTRDEGYRENLAAKTALLAEAEAIDLADLGAAKAALRSVQERWETIGHVPRADKERMESRLRRVEESVRRGEQERWRRTNPEARARAEATTAQFRASVARLEAECAAARERGDERAVADLQARIDSTSALLEAAQRAAADFS